MIKKHKTTRLGIRSQIGVLSKHKPTVTTKSFISSLVMSHYFFQIWNFHLFLQSKNIWLKSVRNNIIWVNFVVKVKLESLR